MIKIIALALLLALPVVSSGQNKIIRDRYNNDVEVWRQQGDRTTVYSRDNEPLYTRYRQGNRVIIRTPDNETQGEEYYER
jgi:hypothetical protein